MVGNALEWADFPEGFTPFFLDPTGARLDAKELSPGVYALLSSVPNVDNVGFVVGDRDVLVVDAHINPAMARQIQERVREVTDKPIRYLVNSNYHGDHTFGNCAFPAETVIIQHRRTADLVPYHEEERRFMLPCVGNDPKILEEVELRRPDVVFDDYLRIDLGGKVVELHYFGPANTPGDTITYVPEAKVAWTGNMTGGNLVVRAGERRADLYELDRAVRPDARGRNPHTRPQPHFGAGAPGRVHAIPERRDPGRAGGRTAPDGRSPRRWSESRSLSTGPTPRPRITRGSVFSGTFTATT